MKKFGESSFRRRAVQRDYIEKPTRELRSEVDSL